MHTETGYIASRRTIIEYIEKVSRNKGTIYTGKW